MNPADFKDKRNAWRTTTLFEETLSKELVGEYEPIYSLVDEEQSASGLPSLKYLYLQARDSNEYLFAELYLGGWDHWQQLCKSWALKPHIEDWRNELKLKLRSEYLLKVREMAAGDGPTSLQAIKYLMEQEGGAAKASAKRGRPNKEAPLPTDGELKRERDDLHQEAQRLGLHVVK